MNVLAVTPACHFPSYGAVQQDIYATIELLIKMGHNVALYTLDQPGQDQKILNSLQEQYQITVKEFLPKKSFLAWLTEAIFNWPLFDRSAFVFDELARDENFLNYLDTFQPGVLLSYGNYSWPLIKTAGKKKIKSIIRSHNFEPVHFWEELETVQKLNPLNLIRFLAKWLGERKSVLESDAVAAISPLEKELYERWRRDNIFLLPLVALHELIKKKEMRSNKNVIDLFYLGATYNVGFHLRGAKELIEEIALRVLNKEPGKFRFHICGSKLPKYLVNQCNGQDIIYEGFVADLDDFFEDMDAGVFPVWNGRGMKQKIFEAICRSFPIVAPTGALGGYGLVNGESALIVSSKDEFITSIFKLSDVNLRNKLAEGAYQFASREFNEDRFKSTLNSLLYV